MEGRWSVLTVTTIGIFMASLDASLLVVGLPVVINELRADLAIGSWLITIYRLAITILLVPIGRLGDMYGRVRLYSMGYFIFALSSLLCALSSDIYQLLFFRSIQGVGGALMFVNSMAIVTDAFAGRGLGLGIGVNQIAINAGTVIGYTLSGVIISLYGWRALFLINVPIGVFGGFWARLRLKETNPSTRVERFDFTGAIMFSTSLTLLMLGLTSGAITSPIPLSLIITSLILLTLFIIVERKIVYPMLDFKLFKIRTFTAGNISNLLNGLSFASLAFLISTYLEIIAGFSPIQAGLSLIPLDLTLILVGPVSGWFSDKIGGRILSTVGLIVSAIALITLSNISINLEYNILLIGLVMAGLGVGLFRSPNASSVMGSVPSEMRGVAAGVRSTIINTSMALSIPFSIAIISTTIPSSESSKLINNGRSSMESLSQIANLIQGIRNSLLASAVLNIIAAVISYLREEKRQPPFTRIVYPIE
ncbi:MAG: MFS transporter [Thaumarchaeota archaeon]|jgi:EmrB/QacA subfamily drug resistance transporter|nr:MFS transporter [Candidatus Geocrenenecus arthurdayi]